MPHIIRKGCEEGRAKYILLFILNYSTELPLCGRVGSVFPKAIKVGEVANSSHAIT